MITYFQERNIMIEELVDISDYSKGKNCSVIISLSVYYPTADRDNLLTKKYVNEMTKILQNVLDDKLLWQVFKDSNHGPMIFMGLDDDAISLKKLMAYFEDNHVLGKWMVIEVFDNINHIIITRMMAGISERKCVICGDSLKKCSQGEKHSVFDIIREINRSYVEYKEGIELF
ncbi:citrate lyase holo-[acyl-carrier protein] synthase [Clostridium oryzae]|uniref:citrate lyase holo-[acyl-carrier protein] synthase n=1 Tax=Clostridium oryzae TaxID=1450648 RepID=A0A1V4IMZ4_9CLOT|nr:citrate lyase holo-[acyl-carrier protein] synthase [Clostridium oryzae]OPJ61422.1 Apo-citrate lyase phosphoribosyl-dephospho-CoA transferase [Clostridium oryzae]